MNIIGNRTLRSELEYRVEQSPDKIWLIYEGGDGAVTRYTYREFDAWVNRTANLLWRLGVRKGDKVNLHLPNRPEFLFLWFGLAKIGAVMVPSNPISTVDDMAYLLGHSESVLSFTLAEHLPTLRAAQASCPGLREIVVCGPGEADAPSFDRLAAEEPEHLTQRVPLAPLDDAAILYTSGTTAKPKGVLVTHANYIWVGEVVSKGMRMGPDDRHLVVMPYFHGNAQYYSTMSSLVVGGSIAVMARFSASRYFEQAGRHQTTVSSFFAAPIRMILNQPPRPTDRQHRMRLIIYAQNITEAQLAQWHQRFGAPLMQIYGMTETIGLPLMNPLDGPRRNMTMGMVTLPYECKVVDEEGRELPPGQVGQLIVRGEPGYTLMRGYFKNPEATRETLRDGWLYTGDNVVMDEAGYFTFVDRAKDMIKRAGENIAAAEVEGVLNQHPAVFESAVIGVPDPIRDEAVKALVILRPGAQATAEELIAFCAQRLAKFKVPEFIEFRESFPRTPVGKIQKHLLRREARGESVS